MGNYRCRGGTQTPTRCRSERSDYVHLEAEASRFRWLRAPATNRPPRFQGLGGFAFLIGAPGSGHYRVSTGYLADLPSFPPAALLGAINTLFLVGSLDAMFDTTYGRLLAFKILLFLVMVVVALVNRFRLAPRISREVSALRALGRTVALEQGLALAVLAIVSVLGTWAPAFYGGRG
jgi:hypothetical protein